MKIKIPEPLDKNTGSSNWTRFLITQGVITEITIIPINPTKTAHHRLKPTFSFKKKNAKIVTKKGLVINKV